MTKLVVTYENRKIKNELHFSGEVFTYTMMDEDFGKEGDRPNFEYQFRERFKDSSIIDDLAGCAGDLDFGDDDEIEEALERLDFLERRGTA